MVGFDDSMSRINTAHQQPDGLPLEVQVSNSLVEVGPSITLASLSEVLAFVVGSFIPMPACHVFPMFAALTVLMDFVLQITIFVALIIFDSMREEDRRVDCFPCLKTPAMYGETHKGISPRTLTRYMKDIHATVLSIWGVNIVVISIFVAPAVAIILTSFNSLRSILMVFRSISESGHHSTLSRRTAIIGLLIPNIFGLGLPRLFARVLFLPVVQSMFGPPSQSTQEAR